MSGKSGSIFGAVLLVAGSCIGGGMLALPVVTGLGGFYPSLALFLCIWLFMTTTAFLLLESNLALGYELSLISLAKKTLGPAGKWITWASFVFLFYSLSIAYIAVSGPILQSIVHDFLGIAIPSSAGGIFFTLLFAAVLLFGMRSVDYVNRLLMLGLGVCYLGLVFFGVSHVNMQNLQGGSLPYTLMAVPVVVISFGFHNMIPSIAGYFKGNVKRCGLVILLGSLVPLVIYLVWQYVMLGILSFSSREELLIARDHGQAATEVLRAHIGKSWVTTFAQCFALFAIVTSFLAQSLSLLDFLADGLRVKKVGFMRLVLVFLVLCPPFAMAMIYPNIFIQAINMAGGLAAVVLFGVMPALMVWKLRYRDHQKIPPLIPTGRVLLVIVLVISLFIFSLELAQELGFKL